MAKNYSDKNSKLQKKVRMYNVSEERSMPGSDDKYKDYPEIRLTSEQLEALKSKKVDDECDLLITAKVTSKSEKGDMADKKDKEDCYRFTLKIKEMGFVK